MTQFTEDGYYFNGMKLEVESEGVNPKQQYGDRKVPLHLVPAPAMVAIAMGLKEGARKYGAYNWRSLPVEAETYVGAALRHLMAWQDGEDIDPDSGNPHLFHAMASLAILVDSIEGGNVKDNRPPKGAGAFTLDKYKEV